MADFFRKLFGGGAHIYDPIVPGAPTHIVEDDGTIHDVFPSFGGFGSILSSDGDNGYYQEPIVPGAPATVHFFGDDDDDTSEW